MSHIAKKRKLLTAKRKLQRAFIRQAQVEGLTNAEATERASILPSDARRNLKVVEWPKL